MNKLNKVISQYFDNYTVENTSEPKKYFRTSLQLPDGGSVSIGLDGKFLHFNIFGSDLRLHDSNVYNGKINVFGDHCLSQLHIYLNELKQLTTN